MSVEDPFEDVREDIVGGLSPAFEADGKGFEAAETFRDMQVVSNGDVASVVWTYECKHVDWWGPVPPSQASLTIRGTTTVDYRGDEPLFHRYIDWLSVYGALGYTLYQRQMVDEPDREIINNPRVP